MNKTLAPAGLLGLSLLGLLGLGLLPAGCSQPLEGVIGKKDFPYKFTTPAEYRTMVPLAGGTVTGSISGAFPTGRTVTLSPFRIAKYETTYELWYEVKRWAAGHGYTFANPGRRGGDVTTPGPPVGTIRHPVTEISWRDAVVWCNAYSEAGRKEPVYRDGSGGVLRDSTTAGVVDNAVMKPGANGYRLPTEAEWEYAARGGNPGDSNWSYTYAGSNTVGDVAVYTVNSGSHTAAVKSKAGGPAPYYGANSLGLYDMSGNVYEWCWDWHVSPIPIIVPETDPTGPSLGTNRLTRGGGWNSVAVTCGVADRDSHSAPTVANPDLGFRVAARP